MSSGHLDRLREAMVPDPGEWHLTGRVHDTAMVGGSRCSCGQEIRYEFIITRSSDGATLIIGSHCIETSVPYLIQAGAGVLAGELHDAYREHRRALDRERRDEKARLALVPAKTDLHRLRRLLNAEQRRTYVGGSESASSSTRRPPGSEFHAACRFARLAYHGEEQARDRVPPPRSASSRKGLTRPPRPVTRRPREKAESGFTPGPRNPLLDQALKRVYARQPDAAQRWQVLEDAKARVGTRTRDSDLTGRPPSSPS